MNQASKRNAIVLLIDGLNPTFLSPYGCSWINTPALDQLAAQSVVFERSVCETIDPAESITSFLSGRHPLMSDSQNNGDFHLLQSCRDLGIQSVLLTDNPSQCTKFQVWFDRVVSLPPASEESGTAAQDIAATHLAKCFAVVMDELPRQASPFLAIIHVTSLARIWDAPSAMRHIHRDEDDPEPLQMVRPPEKRGEFDPDEILGVTHAYAAQLETFDTCMGVLLQELLLDGLLESTMLVLAGLRGFPVGHQGHMGQGPLHLGSDATCVPLLIRATDENQIHASATRSHELTTVSEWFEWIVAWLSDDLENRPAKSFGGTDLDPGSRSDGCREFAVVSSENARAIWTPAWLLVDCDEQMRLFVKPDDRWDVNPVQDRCRRIVESLSDVLDNACAQLRENQPPAIEPLADELVFGLE